MKTIKLKNISESDWVLFNEFCKKSKKSRTKMIESFIRDAGRFELILSTELRMKAIIDDVIAHLDLNTQAYLMNVQQGILPLVEEMAEVTKEQNETEEIE